MLSSLPSFEDGFETCSYFWLTAVLQVFHSGLQFICQFYLVWFFFSGGAAALLPFWFIIPTEKSGGTRNNLDCGYSRVLPIAPLQKLPHKLSISKGQSLDAHVTTLEIGQDFISYTNIEAYGLLVPPV